LRYIALFLLIANIGYFVWTFVRPLESESTAYQPRELINSGLMLVSEFEAQTAALALENVVDSKTCSIVSGFATVDDANGFILLAQRLNLVGLLNLTGGALPSQYRVFLPSEPNRSLATRKLDSVSAAVEAAQLQVETYLITRGPLSEGVGLGVFIDAEEAGLVQSQLSELGYMPEIEEIPRSMGEIRVLLRSLNSNQVEGAEWLELSDDRPDLTRTENLCETIAQASQFP
jgi:hypothetical protein